MIGPDWRSAGGVEAGASARRRRARELLLIACVVLVPIPVIALSGFGLPLPGVVEKGLASLLPGSENDEPAAPAARAGGSSGLAVPASESLRGSTPPHVFGKTTRAAVRSGRDHGAVGPDGGAAPLGDPAAPRAGPGTGAGDGPNMPASPPASDGVRSGEGESAIEKRPLAVAVDPRRASADVAANAGALGRAEIAVNGSDSGAGAEVSRGVDGAAVDVSMGESGQETSAGVDKDGGTAGLSVGVSGASVEVAPAGAGSDATTRALP